MLVETCKKTKKTNKEWSKMPMGSDPDFPKIPIFTNCTPLERFNSADVQKNCPDLVRQGVLKKSGPNCTLNMFHLSLLTPSSEVKYIFHEHHSHPEIKIQKSSKKVRGVPP